MTRDEARRRGKALREELHGAASKEGEAVPGLDDFLAEVVYAGIGTGRIWVCRTGACARWPRLACSSA